MAIIPFDVPESFAPPGVESVNYGRELAREFQEEMHGLAVIPVIELFNRDRWPDKRAEFFTGNYQAIALARAAGYDFVMVGYLDDIKNEHTLTVHTKIIDTQSQITVWAARTDASNYGRDIRRSLGRTWFMKERPDLFQFAERTKLLAECTVYEIENGDPVPE